jgi:hypothetical protein
MTRRRKLGLLAAVVVGAALAYTASELCIRAWLFDGILVPSCPAGDVRPVYHLAASGARRGHTAWITVHGQAHYTTGPSDADHSAGIRRLSLALRVVDPSGKATPLSPEPKTASDGEGYAGASYRLPEGPDGDWKLEATIDSPLGPGAAELIVPLYSPARLHVLTDRPLYQAGQVVMARALALRASDLAPLDGRPGTWLLESPSGEVVLEEKAPLGEWGVVGGSFPLDPEAETGDWSLRWASGGAEDRVTFRVEPFVLPRFRVDGSASRATYRSGEVPRVRGTVRYASGAPVAKATLAFVWTTEGAWPPPTSWLDTTLPQRATTDAAGRWSLELPAIPRDLQGRVTLRAAIAATDDTGDRVDGGLSLLLSEDGIAVEAVTELEGGLVEGFNNRVYLRATTPDGTPLARTPLIVKRTWEASDPGLRAETDEDGVASLQLDPGPAVNVVIPPAPYRPPVRPPPVTVLSATDLLTGEQPSLADQLALDGWPRALAPCARYFAGEGSVTLGLRVTPGGAITAVASAEDALTQCLASTARAQKLAPGRDRLVQLELGVSDPGLPALELSSSGLPGDTSRVDTALAEAARGARSCLSRELAEARPLPRVLLWRTTRGSRALTLEWAADPSLEGSEVLGSEAARCVEQAMTRAALPAIRAGEDDEDEVQTMIGMARLVASPGDSEDGSRPTATTLLGYELSITAGTGPETIGSTVLRLSPGAVPPLRLRATPVLAKAGETVDVELIRGPGYSGALPEKLYLSGRGKPLEATLDRETRRARFTLPADAEGWLEVAWGGARAMVFVQDPAELVLSIKPERETYAPGQTARLAIETKVGGQGRAAAVGVFGVDESLGQITTLLGPDALSRLRPKVNTPSPAFGVLDGQALTLGRVRGANAAQAVVARVAGLPPVDDVDTTVSVSGQSHFDPIEPLTDHFYTVLGQLHQEARAWETSAPAAEKMTPATMAKLFQQALRAVEARGESVTDAYGQRLRLSQLPADLLALCAPQAVVVVGTRLPEDVEDWAAWVAKEQP